MKRLIFILCLLVSPLWALDPSEKLSDPALEARARVLDHEIRCVKCQSEAVASSNADWAKDARRITRELIKDGATDAEVKAWFVTRYGEFVLMDPAKSGSTLALWLAGPGMLLIAILGAGLYVRGRSKADNSGPNGETIGLTDEETAKLREILKD